MLGLRQVFRRRGGRACGSGQLEVDNIEIEIKLADSFGIARIHLVAHDITDFHEHIAIVVNDRNLAAI